MKWYEFDVENESVQECRERKLQQMPLLSGAELEVLRKCQCATWDGNVPSKSARDDLYRRGLIVRYNGWQIASLEGLAILEVLSYLKD